MWWLVIDCDLQCILIILKLRVTTTLTVNSNIFKTPMCWAERSINPWFNHQLPHILCIKVFRQALIDKKTLLKAQQTRGLSKSSNNHHQQTLLLNNIKIQLQISTKLHIQTSTPNLNSASKSWQNFSFDQNSGSKSWRKICFKILTKLHLQYLDRYSGSKPLPNFSFKILTKLWSTRSWP